jgi:hypothetical protein
MPVAVGIYLPLGLSVPILFGGIIRSIVRGLAGSKADASAATHRGILFSSGLIAGESIAGIIVAFLIVGRVPLPRAFLESVPVLRLLVENTAISIVLFCLAIAGLVYVSLARAKDRR